MVTPLYITEYSSSNYNKFTKCEIGLFEKIVNSILELKNNLSKVDMELKLKIHEMIKKSYFDTYLPSFELAMLLALNDYSLDDLYCINKKFQLKISNNKSIIKFKFKRFTGVLNMKIKMKSLYQIDIEKVNNYNNIVYSHKNMNNINKYFIDYYFDISNIKNINNLMIFFICIFISNIKYLNQPN